MDILNNISRGLNKVGFEVKKNADWILLVGGIIGVGAGVVKIFKDSEKNATVTAELRDRKEKIEASDASDSEKKAAKKDAYLDAFKDYFKINWLSVGLITGGEIAQFMSHSVLNKRYTIASTALAGYAATFETLHNNVVKDQGESKWQEYLTGSKATTVELKKDGTVVTTETPIHTDTTNVYIPHSFLFDESNSNWSKNGIVENYNKNFLTAQLIHVNQLLTLRGYLTENEIRDVFGAPRTVQGQSAGVFYKNPDGTTNQVSIGLDRQDERAQAFRDGSDPSFLAIITYSDGKPIEDDIYKRLIKEGRWDMC